MFPDVLQIWTRTSLIKKINLILKILILVLVVAILTTIGLRWCTDDKELYLFLLPPISQLAGASGSVSPSTLAPTTLSQASPPPPPFPPLCRPTRQLPRKGRSQENAALFKSLGFKYSAPATVAACRWRPLLLVLVGSSPTPGAQRRRNAARCSWAAGAFNGTAGLGDGDPRARVAYVMGSTDNDGILLEALIAMDVVEGSILDTRMPSVLKHVMALKWATTYCASARFVLRTDDAAYVVTPSILRFLENIARQPGASDLVMCRVLCEDERQSIFPDWGQRKQQCFCDSRAVLYSSGAVSKLLREVECDAGSLCSESDLTGEMVARANLTLTPMTVVKLPLSMKMAPDRMRQMLKEAVGTDARRLLLAHQKRLDALRLHPLLLPLVRRAG